MFSRKYRIHAILILSVLAIIIVPQISNRPDKNKSEASAVAAQEFLQMVDAGKYADSWQISDPYLKETVPLNDWKDKLNKIRETLGALEKRELDGVSFTAPAKEFPDSEVIMLEYVSQFKLKETKEVVTVVQGADNRWRVVGYFIQ